MLVLCDTPGLMVGRIARVDRRADTGFARILVTPSAVIDDVRYLLVLEPLSAQLPPRLNHFLTQASFSKALEYLDSSEG